MGLKDIINKAKARAREKSIDREANRYRKFRNHEIKEGKKIREKHERTLEAQRRGYGETLTPQDTRRFNNYSKHRSFSARADRINNKAAIFTDKGRRVTKGILDPDNSGGILGVGDGLGSAVMPSSQKSGGILGNGGLDMFNMNHTTLGTPRAQAKTYNLGGSMFGGQDVYSKPKGKQRRQGAIKGGLESLFGV